MKLTAEQLFTLQDACTARAEQLLQRSHLLAADSASADYWKQEAAAAHQLALLFKDAIKVEITTAALETPPAAEATSGEEEPAQLVELREQLKEKERNYWDLQRQARTILAGTQTTSPTAADAAAPAAAAVQEAPTPPTAPTAPCGAPTPDDQRAGPVFPAPDAGPAGASSAPGHAGSLQETGLPALTAPAQETAPHVPPSPASSARPGTTQDGAPHSSPQPTQPQAVAN